MFYLDPRYLLIVSPALLLALWAQFRVKSAFSRGSQIPAQLSGAAAARYILDRAGCEHVDIEETHGFLSDHYDPRHKVLRLSPDVYHTRSAAAVGIAAHEAGHALQDATNYMPLIIRNAAVPAAQVGPIASIVLLILGAILASKALILLGLLAYSGILFFQLVNLPVEFDASNRAKRILDEYQIVQGDGSAAVRSVLNAAGWTYVAATLQTLLTLVYYVMVYGGILRRDD